jgi:hypothetical protein
MKWRSKPLQLLEILQKQVVGERRFELPTSWSRTKRATKLRYSPTRSEFLYEKDPSSGF